MNRLCSAINFVKAMASLFSVLVFFLFFLPPYFEIRWLIAALKTFVLLRPTYQ
jgi:hypothetical protein